MASKRRPVSARATERDSQTGAGGLRVSSIIAAPLGTSGATGPSDLPAPDSTGAGLPHWPGRWLLFRVVLIAAVFLINVYRAAEQSVTFDEAWSYLSFAAGPWANIFLRYEAGNHVLHSILIKLTCGLLGSSQLALRLPSLLAGLVFLINAMRLSRLLAPRSRMFAILSFLALSINPLVLDYLSMARGYSLALAMFSCATLEALGLVFGPAPRPRRFLFLGVFLALAVSSNLTFLFPSAAVFLVLALMIGLRDRKAPTARRRSWLDLVCYGTVPACLVAGLIVYLPVSHASKGHFYWGQSTLKDSIVSLVSDSLDHHPDLYGNFPSGMFTVPFYAAATAMSFTAIAALVLLARVIRRRQPPDAAVGRFIFLQLCTDVTLLLLFVAHQLTGLLYPDGRTGLYLVFCFTLMLISLTGLGMRPPHRYWMGGVIAGWALLVAQFVSQLSITYYANWRYDASTKRVFEVIRVMSLAHPERRSRISYSWNYAPALEFYRRVYDSQNIEPVQIWSSTSPTPLDGYDYYVLDGGDKARASAVGLIPVLYYELSNTTVEIPPPQKPF